MSSVLIWFIAILLTASFLMTWSFAKASGWSERRMEELKLLEQEIAISRNKEEADNE